MEELELSTAVQEPQKKRRNRKKRPPELQTVVVAMRMTPARKAKLLLLGRAWLESKIDAARLTAATAGAAPVGRPSFDPDALDPSLGSLEFEDQAAGQPPASPAPLLEPLINSPRAAREWLWLCERAGEDRARAVIAELGKRRPYPVNIARLLGLQLPEDAALPRTDADRAANRAGYEAVKLRLEAIKLAAARKP